MRTSILSIMLLVGLISCSGKNEKNNSSNLNSTKTELSQLPVISTVIDPDLKGHIPATNKQVELINNSKDKFEIKYGYSFGECTGFCQVEKQVTSKGILTQSKRWKDGAVKTEYSKIDSINYVNLVSQIDFDSFIKFNEDLGCGDCADRGNEWLIIKHNNQSKKIAGSYGYKAEPVQRLLEFLRKK